MTLNVRFSFVRQTYSLKISFLDEFLAHPAVVYVNSRLIRTDVSIAQIGFFVKQQKKIFRKVATDFGVRWPGGVGFWGVN
ncbi:MAG: hypothetical protein WCJ35_25380, partial [Planctomycetota bacterium]